MANIIQTGSIGNKYPNRSKEQNSPEINPQIHRQLTSDKGEEVIWFRNDSFVSKSTWQK
jgi:hypothetical protein